MTSLSPGDANVHNAHPHHKGVSRRIAIWLLIWFAIALSLRLTNLTTKAAWMDEVATTLFSLGNYSRLIPTGEIIRLDQLLRPLQLNPGASISDVVTHLLVEDNHPPTYFVLAHEWVRFFHHFFGVTEGYASLWAQRALPALFGALAVPATYLLAWLSFRDRTIGLLCAALMAVSPFSVFLSQEARHYSLAILTVIASLCCFVVAVQALSQHKSPTWHTVITWIIINVIGLTIHFFCGLTLMAEGLTLWVILIQQCLNDDITSPVKNRSLWRQSPWLRIYSVAAGTLAGALLWLPILTNFYGSPQTSFLRAGTKNWQYWFNPLVQSLASWLYALLSPVSRGYSWQAITAIVVTCAGLLVYAIWLLATLQRSFRFQLRQPNLRASTQAISGFFVMANALFLAICYSLGFDITRGHRYSFVFFPSLILLVGLSLAPFWKGKQDSLETADPKRHLSFSQVKLPFMKRHISGPTFVKLVIVVSFLGAQVMVQDYSSLKFYRPDRLINLIQTTSPSPTQTIVIGASTIVTEQPSVIGLELMSIAWEIQRHFNPKSPEQGWDAPLRFIIVEDNAAEGKVAKVELVKNLGAIARPFDLWLLKISPDLSTENCTVPPDGNGNKGSFVYTHYVCTDSP